MNGIVQALAAAEPVSPPVPLPLRRALPPAEPFPLNALGGVLASAARAIMDRVRVPDAIAGQSVLAAASLACQAHADIVLPATGRARPLSLFLVTVAASGERKSAADSEALWPIRKREEALRDRHAVALPSFENAKAAYDKARDAALRKAKGDYAAGRAALDALGPAPAAPLVPLLLMPEPTLQGMHKLFGAGEPSLGLFSDEAGGFLGGHGMNEDNRLRMASGLSEMWDGSAIRRVRVEGGAVIMPGRRLASHLMVQPGIADRLLANAELSQQGLLSRLLVAAPVSLAGTRLQLLADPASEPALKAYGARLLAILEHPQPRAGPAGNELNPRALILSDKAAAMWRAFADWCERELASGKPLEPVRGFANKLAEHALRIAGVLQLVDDLEAGQVEADALARGIELARFYAGEALRLFDAGAVSRATQRAESLLRWMHESWGHSSIGIAHIYQRGPNAIRDKAAALPAIKMLEDHGWLVGLEGGATIEGDRHRQAWRIVARP